MKHFLIFLTISLLTYTGNAQTAEDSVKNTVNKLFTAMKTADAAMLRSCFADSAVLQTVTKNKEGLTAVINESVSEFAESISKQQKGSLDERIVFDGIKIDGPLASVWAPYHFYFNNNFSHCGIDAFLLVKINGEWKIQYLIDTRKRTGCK